MIRMVYSLSTMLLFLAAGVLVQCGKQWSREYGPEGDSNVLLQDKLNAIEGAKRTNSQGVETPLVAQAKILARYLNPPPPPAREIRPPKASAPPPPRPVRIAPKFRLLSISFYQSDPERSLALVSEPGKGGYWVKQGDRLGHLVVESVQEKAIVYRDGDQLHEMAIAAPEHTIQLAQEKTTQLTPGPSDRPLSNQSIRPNLRFLNGRQ